MVTAWTEHQKQRTMMTGNGPTFVREGEVAVLAVLPADRWEQVAALIAAIGGTTGPAK